MESIDLDKLERSLRSQVRRHSSTDLLIWVRRAFSENGDLQSPMGRAFKSARQFWHPHIGACLASYAVQWSNPDRGKPLTVERFLRLYSATSNFVTLDPIGFDDDASAAFQEDYDGLLLRMSGSQFPYYRPSVFNLSRAKLLWGEAVQLARQRAHFAQQAFDEFLAEICGGTIEELIAVGAVLFAAAHGSRSSFTRDYFEQARDQLELSLPDKARLGALLNFYAADVREFRQIAEDRKLRDRRYRAYDGNPLLRKPVVRPRGTRLLDAARDQLVAPVPALVARRVSNGIYHEGIARGAEAFLTAFGFVFEEYVGLLLRRMVPSDCLVSESDLRRLGYQGKVPDFVLLERGTAVLVECKACRMPMQWLGQDHSDNYYQRGLKQVRTAQKQLSAFIDACRNGEVAHPQLALVSEFTPVIATFEPIYLANRDPFRAKLMRNWSTELPDWTVLALGELEDIEPHVRAGISLREAVDMIRTVDLPFNALHERTGLSRSDSFLAEVADEVWRDIGVDNL